MQPVEILSSVNNLLRFLRMAEIKLWCREQRTSKGMGACSILEYQGKRYVLVVKEI